MEDKVCVSCKKKVVNNRGQVRFPCPSCTSYEIVRCQSCRSNATRYSCPSCGFLGPH